MCLCVCENLCVVDKEGGVWGPGESPTGMCQSRGSGLGAPGGSEDHTGAAAGALDGGGATRGRMLAGQGEEPRVRWAVLRVFLPQAQGDSPSQGLVLSTEAAASVVVGTIPASRGGGLAGQALSRWWQ